MRLYTLLKKIMERIVRIGTVYEGTAITTTIPHNTNKKVSKLELQPGVYSIVGNIEFGVNDVNAMTVSSLTYNNWSYAISRGTMIGGGGLSTTIIVAFTASTTVYLTAYQDSGSSVTLSKNMLKAVRIK